MNDRTYDVPDQDTAEDDQPRDTDIPLWQVIASALRTDILEARYTPGTPLPSETALASRYSVSRPTVRDAVKALSAEGLVSVVRGRGTFVRPVPDRYVILLGIWPREDLATRGFDDTARAWGWIRIPLPREEDDEGQPVYGRSHLTAADRDTATLLGIRTGSNVLRRHSLWMHANRAVIDVTSSTIAEIIPDWNTKASLYHSHASAFYDAITEGRGPITWQTLVTARMPYADERERLGLDIGQPILLIRRLILDKDGRPLEVTEIKASADQFETAYARESLTIDADEPIDQPGADRPGTPDKHADGRVLLAL
ncbi:hypothetical protein Psi02_77920 [Planotetraspora silvatica]|uniref:HTH gntR-type domain-containing protein n=1 Tax=Planotetraspora silvatica TaxID=234614 RepID=A0A8J3UU78_9ACTN|nr:GntR family transcriptional regulator [Planotetraspora silvatica]GII51368.1 hypothetical protein Psi02_77920 [Planotetraspora silvatica]